MVTEVVIPCREVVNVDDKEDDEVDGAVVDGA